MVSSDITSWNNGIAAWGGSAANVVYVTRSNSPLVVSDTYRSDIDWDGLTNYAGSSGQFTSVRAYLNHYYTQSYSATVSQGVAAHELGHAVGLGHSAASCALMLPTTPGRDSCGAWIPKADDIAGMNSLY
ncbi:matrixin family metalloprotease [Leekyejoonella antrihumi]